MKLIKVLILVLVCMMTLNAQAKKIRIAVGTFMHETCTFCPTPTGVAEWEYYGKPMKGEDVLQANDYVEGFVFGASEYLDVELTGVYSPRRAKGGSSGSWITKEAFDKYSYGMAEDIKNTGPYDGVYLALHGAMAVTGFPKSEAELVRRIRKAVGDIPIFVTLDLHANEDHEISDAADAVFIVKRYPHYDSGSQGMRAARLMVKTIRGNYKPVMATRKPGIITPTVFQWTGEAPAMEIMERARRWEDRINGVYVSVAFGFPFADVPDVGATIIVVTNNDQERADKIADDMNEYIWRVRETFAGKKLPKTKEGVKIAVEAAKNNQTPVVIADHADRTGNSTHILAELIKQGASNVCIATISDHKAISKLVEENKVGDKVSINVGGYEDQFAGEPVKIEGVLTFLGKYGKFKNVAVIEYGNDNKLIITPVLHQVTTTDIYAPLGIDKSEIDIFVLKTRVHFRRGYYENGFAKTIVLIDAPGLGPADLSKVPYKNVPIKELYPISETHK